MLYRFAGVFLYNPPRPFLEQQMDYFKYSGNELFCEEVPVRDLAGKFGTPLYVYSKRTVLEHFEKTKKAFAPLDPLVCFSVKANSSLAILKALKAAGSGFDAVSGGEIFRILKAGGEGNDIVFAGVGKTEQEIRAALSARIRMFNVESGAELARIDGIAGSMGAKAPVAIRVNPDVDPHTHRYITTGKRENKFGLDVVAASAMARGMGDFSNLRLMGFHMHIGSQITRVEPFVRSIEKMLALIADLRAAGVSVEWLNIGGGFGIIYTDKDKPPAIDDYAKAIVPLLKNRGLRLALEPGRFIVGNAGILLTRVQYVKETAEKLFIVVDAAMNDLIRPSLYEAYHRIEKVEIVEGEEPGSIPADIVGPICESGDFLGKDRYLPGIRGGDLLAVFGAGAYGFSMSSNYNSRPRPAEIVVDGSAFSVARKRETYEDLVRGE